MSGGEYAAWLFILRDKHKNYIRYDTIWARIPFISGSLQNFISDSNVKSKPYSSNKSIDKLEKKL